MPYYPIFMDLTDKVVIIIGGGRVAQRKTETFLEYGASVSIISRELTPGLEKYCQEDRIKYLGKEFHEDLLNNAALVIAATDDPQLNQKISVAAKKRGLLINAVDQPAECNFIVPSIVRKGDLQIAVSTAGKSPALAKKLRSELEDRFGDNYKAFLNLMGRLRNEILEKGLPREINHRIFNEIVESPILDAIERGDLYEVSFHLNRILKTNFSPEDVTDYLRGE